MNATSPNCAGAIRVLGNAFKLSLWVVIIGLGAQAAMALFDRGGEPPAEGVADADKDLGAWTFAGEGLAVTVRSIAPDAADAELSAPATTEATLPPPAEGETRLLELLASLEPSEPAADGRRRWRKSLGGIEGYAETNRTGGAERLTIARAAVAGPEGLTLLEIRPAAATGGNGKAAGGVLAKVNGAKEIARRLTANGDTTGELSMTDAVPEQAAAAAKQSLGAGGWAVDDLAGGEDRSARSFACRRGNERLQVVVFRNDGVGQTMILAVRE